jgi:hypothetical protein
MFVGSQLTYALIFAVMEVPKFYNKKVFHRLWQQQKIKLPNFRMVATQTVGFGIFVGSVASLSIVFSAVSLHYTQDTIKESLHGAVLTWAGMLILKNLYELFTMSYFNGQYMLYMNPAIAEIMYFSANCMFNISLRLTFMLRNREGVVSGVTMLLFMENLVFMYTVRRSLLHLRDRGRTESRESLNRKVIIKLMVMQVCSSVNVFSPYIALGMLWMCKRSDSHSDFVRDIDYIQEDKYGEMFFILSIQLIPTLLIDSVKLSLLRHLGFDLMAFWKAQKNIRLQLGKAVATIFSSVFVMLLLMNQVDSSNYFLYDSGHIVHEHA